LEENFYNKLFKNIFNRNKNIFYKLNKR